MELCLYDPALGYYSRGREQFGKAGDFYTSSDVHAVFGRLLARQFEEMWQALDRPPQIEILELGPGRGLFARDVLDWSQKKFPEFFAALKYTLQESSPALRAKLEETLHEHIAAGRATVASVARTLLSAQVPQERQEQNEPPNAAVHRTCEPETPAIVFANEFFDALPVEILSARGKLHLAFEADRLIEAWLPPTAAELEFLDRYSVHPEANERVEVPLAAQQWAAKIASRIRQGFLLAIDYGYTRAQQLAGRHRGTLMAYRRHSASPNPYEAPGEQDLTAHVNFTALTAALEQAGMQPQKLVTQSQFLMGIGERTQFSDAFEQCRLPQEQAKVALQLKHLISPTGMGETFQVLVASRAVDLGKVAALSGLTFGQ
ncbi:MAG: SAM-dependent methyltransferase [Terriglobales bacterium]|jgi:SAM-dependent MidA family methyltransferase